MTQPTSIICPLCNDPVGKLLFRYHLDNERLVLEQIKRQNPEWTREDGFCSRCLDYYHTELVMQHRMLPEIGPHFPVKSADDFIILPTGLRLNADPRYTGKGVTICFIDSDFYPHPDLTAHKNRIKAIIDLAGSHTNDGPWHGTMTSVVCAGDGYLSNGLYKGIAADAELVLLKVQDGSGHINDDSILKALQWILQNHRRYSIRIVNISLSANENISWKQSEIDILAEQLIAQGITIVAAIGNDEQGTIKAPANAPNVITVGGIDDGNQLEEEFVKLYHSSWGKTTDGLSKPELIAHAMWIAAPILPGTQEQQEAELLYSQLNEPANDGQKEMIRQRIQTGKYISPHYTHVDGTSFAAPIVCAVIAQLLEISPALTPAMIRAILFGTAKRLRDFPAERQGFGMIHPRKATLKILNRQNADQPGTSPIINNRQRTIGFYIQHDCASQISLAGSFNDWAHDALLLEPGNGGLWKIEIPMLPAGRYQYKFYVDDIAWVEDINNPYREPDGFSGFNSILIIDN